MTRAFLLGVADGWHQPRCLSSGRTWGDARDGWYDRGVNVGQRLRSPRRHQRP